MRRSTAGLVLIVLFPTLGRQEMRSASVSGSLYTPGLRPEGAVVYLISDRDTSFALPNEAPMVDQVGLRFVPQTVVALPGTDVEFRNSDPVLHNVFGPPGPGAGFDLGTYPRPEYRSQRFEREGAHVILCNVHPEMVAYVLVVPTTYHSLVGGAGDFFIDDVPPGQYSINVWHPQADAFSTALTVGDGVTRINVQLEIYR